MTAAPPSPAEPRRASPYRAGIWILGLLILVLVGLRLKEALLPAGPVMHTGAARSESALRRIQAVPPFSLTERSGRNITNRDLSGKIWIASFVYTTCPGPCPLITRNMAQLQAKLADDPRVQLVTFTVDPQTDTPPVLAAYADKFGADKDRWWFLTGPEKPLYDLIQNGFYQAVQDNRGQAPAPDQFTVTHSTNLAVVDADGILRGSFDALGEEGRAAILDAVRQLEREKP